PRHVRALEAACSQRGVAFLNGAEVHTLLPGEDRILAAVTAHGEVFGDRFLVAAGAWSDLLLRQLRWAPGIRPIRGQIALLKPDQPLLSHVLMHGSRYLVPRRDGYVLAGSTEEDEGFDKRTTPLGI